MVYQVRAGYSVMGREIKVPQTFIQRCARIVIMGKTLQLTDLLNVLHVRVAGDTVTLADCEAIAGLVDDWVSSSYVGLFSNTTAYIGTHVRSMEGLTVPAYTIADRNLLGEDGTDPLPTYVSLPVKLATGTTGHGGHGMFHVWFPGEDKNDVSGQPAPVYISAVGNAMTALLNSLIASDYQPVVASFKYITMKPILTAQVRTFWGSVVSRKLEHGR